MKEGSVEEGEIVSLKETFFSEQKKIRFKAHSLHVLIPGLQQADISTELVQR
jgi:hypothetical protein